MKVSDKPFGEWVLDRGEGNGFKLTISVYRGFSVRETLKRLGYSWDKDSRSWSRVWVSLSEDALEAVVSEQVHRLDRIGIAI